MSAVHETQKFAKSDVMLIPQSKYSVLQQKKSVRSGYFRPRKSNLTLMSEAEALDGSSQAAIQLVGHYQVPGARSPHLDGFPNYRFRSARCDERKWEPEVRNNWRVGRI